MLSVNHLERNANSVCTLVFCTIPNPIKALEEIRRVCKPEGQILLFEHVKIKNRFFGQLQEWFTPFWKRICDGCHLNRNTLELVRQEGFKVTSIQRYYKDIFLVIEAINKKHGLFSIPSKSDRNDYYERNR
ncbi:class I SAM-dependent methyltransferase [Paenibacillus agricola]|uniref:class I SAM-dependent methyltransferase n=1 Tax=Paenibacillus agricola TaxID=2716264 RepID=UPI001A9FC959|nr:methyltransferase domain-containing protein [Paenibacillus agricola]